jgi:UDP-N-acetylglucosamine 2-epimerase (non-hydrolysing)
VKVAYILGARPNIVKMAPVIAALRQRLPVARHVVVHTSQHYDRLMSDVFLDELGLPEPDYLLGVGSGTHAEQTARAMERLDPIVNREQPDIVIVPGDVNSTLAAALVCAKLGVSLAHLEAGLRSFDRTMPEEINRIVADEFSDYLFVHSTDPMENLRMEGIQDDRIFFVGNTMIDTLVAMEPHFRSAHTAERLGFRPGGYLLVTLHRPALVDGTRLREVISRLNEVARELPVVFPAHPRTQKMVRRQGLKARFDLIDPLGYIDFLSVEADAAAVLTDSGGVQEETTYLGVRCFTLRDNTERPVTERLGTNTVLGLDPARIADIVPALDEPPEERPDPPPLWDGRAAQRIADVLETVVGPRLDRAPVQRRRSPSARHARRRASELSP